MGLGAFSDRVLLLDRWIKCEKEEKNKTEEDVK
jgi:hypothetical protein